MAKRTLGRTFLNVSTEREDLLQIGWKINPTGNPIYEALREKYNANWTFLPLMKRCVVHPGTVPECEQLVKAIAAKYPPFTSVPCKLRKTSTSGGKKVVQVSFKSDEMVRVFQDLIRSGFRDERRTVLRSDEEMNRKMNKSQLNKLAMGSTLNANLLIKDKLEKLEQLAVYDFTKKLFRDHSHPYYSVIIEGLYMRRVHTFRSNHFDMKYWENSFLPSVRRGPVEWKSFEFHGDRDNVRKNVRVGDEESDEERIIRIKRVAYEKRELAKRLQKASGKGP